MSNKITDAATARNLIEEWRLESKTTQLRNLRLARENLELDQMYYEQKDNRRGMERCDECLLVLREREMELLG